jgi:O-antigen ligase
VAILLGIAFSFTRAAWVATALVVPIALGVWAVWHGLRKGLAMAGGILGIVVVSVVASGAATNWTRHLVSVTEERNASNLERLNRWSAALEMARTHPWIGVGYGAYPDVYRIYRRKAIVTEQVFYRMGVHNELLRLLAETGVVGFSAALWLLAVVAAGAWRVYARREDPERGLLALAILAGLATYAVHSLFNSYLGVDKVTIPFWFGIGALEALRRSTNPSRGS